MPEILYRKWRPRTFGELAGQEHVATTLRNALATGRVAHAYLFSGPRGTGKTSTGRVLGKALNCASRQGGEPCNTCESCLSFLAGRAMDLIELDAASNRGIDEIRSLRDKVAFAPGAGEYKVYLIDEVHMLTDAAFNALLKTLEEPPPHVVFILATTETHRLPATIASRCQRFDFRRIPVSAAVETMERICAAESISCEPEALEQIARSGTGSLRDSINLLDQLATSYGKELSIDHVRTGLGLIGDERSDRLARAALAGDLAAGLEILASVRDDGLDLRQFQRELVEELRTLLLMKSGVEPAGGVTAERRRELTETASTAETAALLTALKAFGEADLKADPNSTLPLDIALAECILVRANGQTGNRANEVPAPEARSASAGTPARRTAPPSNHSETLEKRATPPPPRPEPTHSTAEEAPSRVGPAAPREQAPGRDAPESAHTGPTGELSNPSTMAPDNRKEPPVSEVVATVKGGAALARLRDNMREIYSRARTSNPQLGALLNSGCDIISVEDGQVVVGFRFRIHADKASEKPFVEALSAIVADLVQHDVIVTCRHAEGIADWKQRESASRSPLVRAAQEMGARVLSAERPEPPEENR